MQHSHHFQFIAALRQFFTQRDFTDVLTPPLVDCPVIGPHIQPFRLAGKNARYLHTSPEFWMKHLLSEGMQNIFTICYCFRDEPRSPIHRPQFLLLEWYRADADYERITQDLRELTSFVLRTFERSDEIEIKEMSVQALFQESLGVDILQLSEATVLRNYIETSHPDVPLPASELLWEDYYHLLFLNKIEPILSKHRFLILKEYPAQLRALSRLKKDDPRVCERFEFFIDGMEVANCYGELTDLQEQKQCFAEFNRVRKRSGEEQMPEPRVLFRALEKGIPPSAGIALGVERFLHALLGVDSPFFENITK